MTGRTLRGAVVGASSLLGKELAEELNHSGAVVWDLTLLDSSTSSGQITSAGDEALLIQPISSEAFSNIDVAFFACEGATVLAYWKIALSAGAAVVDLTGVLELEPGVKVRSPLVRSSDAPDLAAAAVVSAHPAAIMLASVRTGLQSLKLARMVATVLQPASELGSAGVEEMHQQTVGLLSFKPLKKEIYDTHVAFNIVPSFGPAAKMNLSEVRKEIIRHARALAGMAAPDSLDVQLVQAPVFHGYTASVFIELEQEVSGDDVRQALCGRSLEENQSPSNENVAGKSEIMFHITNAGSSEGGAFWLWLAADNLRLAAHNAAVCGLEIAELRHKSGVN